ncbi:PREDICTED: sperm-associated antigen 5 isoform X3 [Myotis brandtii]|uniref:sperm-associated antigen 5 isoform X3 n=1 Tax=Myotis brandtii TaxID=109478 RepID=UPI0007041309|nr:PREDICTED: sperm-associated antigen 5 isoform X3 [Myotis brandtii]
MWRVKQLSLSPSPQPGEPPVRTPLRELNLQPEALTSSAKGPGICYSLTPSLCKLGLQEGSNNLSPLDFENAKMTDSPSEQFSHPSKWLEACQHESDEQPLNLIPQNNSTPKTSEEAVDPVENNAVKTMVLVPSAGGQQQDITLEAHLNTIAETNSFSLDEPLRPGDLLRNGVEPCMKDSFSEVVPAMPEKLTFQDPPAHLLEYPPNPCSEQQLPCSEESPRDSKTETVPEDLVSSESNAFLPSSMRCLPPSTAFPADFPVSHVDSGQEIVEHRAIEEREVSFSILPEEAELRDQTLVSNTQDIPSTCLTPNPGEMESQAAPGPAVEDAGRILISDTGPWMSPLAWLEKGVNTSVMLENLRQSLSLPSALQDAATGTAPSSTCSVGTWFTPPAPPQEKSTNTSQTGLLGTKDSASEREHLLWGNHPPDLTALSRRDLEDNLMNSLLILEVLSRPLRNWKSQLTTPHPEVQDSSTQTDTADTSRSGINKKLEHLHGNREIGQTLQQTRNVMQSWVLVSKELISLLYLSLLHLEEDKTTVSQESRRTETLVSCCFDVLKKLRARLQSLKTEREEAKHGEEMALRGKDAAESVLEAFCAHASQRISQLQQNLASMGEFRGLLKETQTQLINKKLEHLHGNREIGQTLQQTRNVMSWVLVSKELISLLYLSLLHLEEDKTTVSQESRRTETLVSCCFDVLKKLRARLQSLKTEREEAKHGEEMALRGKDAAESVLEAFCAHASQRISQLQQNLASMGEFRGLLKETQTQLVGFHTEQEEVAQETASFTSILQQDWMSMQQDYITWTALLSRSRELTEKLTAKSRQTLQERDAAVEEKQQVSRELEQVSAQLEDCKGQIEQLELENSRLATDLRAQLQMLASMQSQLQELQSQHAHCTRDLAMKDELLCQLTQSNEKQATQWQKEEMTLKHIQAELQQQHAVLAKEVQDLKETLEFADQENQVAHLELGQVECQLKSTLEVLRERSLQCEDLKDTVENLKDKLASTVAENQEKDLEKTRQYSQELRVLTEQLQNLTFFLHTKLKETAEPETLLKSTACASAQEHPPSTDSTFLGSILTAMADKEPESAPVALLGSDKSAFTRVASMVSPQPTETPGMEKSLEEMSTMTLELQSLCSLLQESKEEAVRTLQRKICDLQARLQAQEEQHQEAQKAKEADIEKLNQALCLRYKNEKELQEVIQQQNEKILEQIDKSGELISLREEVTQLTRSLRRAETETKVLQETLAGQLDPNCQPMATNWIQEKVWLSQEVDKLRVMFLEMKNEKEKLMVKFQSHRNILEENLRRSDKELKKLDDIVQHIYETLLSIPEVVRGCKELQELLEFLS